MRFDAARSLTLRHLVPFLFPLAACSATIDGTLPPDSTSIAVAASASGAWSTKDASTSLIANLTQSGSSVSGSGTLGTPPLAPTTGPATPAYTGDNYTITSGNFVAPIVTFSATLGANPDGVGGFFRGSLTWSGSVTGKTMTGTATYTPPRTVTQVFAQQTATGVTLTKP